jgi:hypothetical protein
VLIPLQVNVRFVQRLDHPPTLALIKLLAGGALPKQVAYIGEHGHRAIKAMQLVNRGRLSAAHDPPRDRSVDDDVGVQPVEQEAYEAVVSLGTRGGWEDLITGGKAGGKAKAQAEEQVAQPAPVKRKTAARDGEGRIVKPGGKKGVKVVKAEELPKVQAERRSKRTKR